MMSHFVRPTFEGESPCPGAADLLVWYDTDVNGELNAAETQVMAFNIMPCVEVRHSHGRSSSPCFFSASASAPLVNVCPWNGRQLHCEHTRQASAGGT